MYTRFLNMVEPAAPIFRDVVPFLAERGIKTEIVISDSEYRSASEPLQAVLRHPLIRVSIMPVSKNVSGTRLLKLLKFAEYMTKAAAYTLFGPAAIVNIFLTQPPLFFSWGYVLRLLRQQRYYVVIMDLYPDTAIHDGLLTPDGLPARLLRSLSQFVLRRADKVIVIGRCMMERVVQQGISKDRIRVIPNWVNEHTVYPVLREENRLSRDCGLENNFVVLYSGNMGVAHYFDDIIKAAVHLQDLSDLRFVFIGGGARRREIEEAKAKYDLANILLLPIQPTDLLAQSLSVADVHFISLRPGFEGLMVPSKAYGAFAVGRPIIYQGSPDGEVARVIQESQVGTVVTPGDLNGLEKAILSYYHDRVLTKEQGLKALRLSQSRLNRNESINAYLEVIRSIPGLIET